MIFLKSLQRQSLLIILSLMFVICITVININSLPVNSFLLLVLSFLLYISFVLCFKLLGTWIKAWILSSTLLLIVLLAYSQRLSNLIILIHILIIILLALMLYQYIKARIQEKHFHQLHQQTMQVLLRKNPPVIHTIDYTYEPVIIINHKGIIVEANPQASLLLSLPESSLIGQSISTISGILANFKPTKVSKSGEFTFINQEKRIKHLRFVTRPLLNSPIPSETLVIFFDISEEKKRSEAYLQAAKLSVIGQVSAGLAHELRNPLTTIKGFMQLITPQQWPEYFRPYQQLILEEIDTMDQLLNKFVLSTSPSAPKMQPVNLTQTIDALTQAIQEIHLMRDLSLELDLPAHAVLVMGDPEQLYQALLSLVNNAIEASPKEGKIIIRLTEQEAYIRICVKDDGPGIPENLRQRILEPFFTTQKDGTGLGLTITQQIVLAHHGKLHFSEDTLSSGTEALIDLPSISNFQDSLSA